MADTDLNLWFIEVVPSPGMLLNSQDRKSFYEIIKIKRALKNDEDIDEIVAKSNWEWIIDERKYGTDRYHGLVSQDCIID